ncbi:putative high-affinity glucose transporter of the major facilitator superfamily [Gautieria morchelliformis]|nr:putative high-affinity glucose transporter of the major facilitator superfamily [Gautieria morchelliformis]
MSFTANSRVYLLTLVAYLGAFIFGYDTGVAGGVLQMRGFQRDFGLSGQTPSEVTAVTSHVVSILQGGCFFGALLGAPLSERIGRRKALIVVSIIFLIGAAVQVAGIHKLSFIYGGRFVSGLGVGAMSMLSPTYVAEVAPKEVRGRITGLFQVCLTVGIAISYWIVYGVNLHFGASTQQWRIPMGFQVAPVGLMFILLLFCRESPRWLARHNQEEQSLTNLAWFRKLPVDDPRVGEEFTEILATVKEERESRGPLRQCLHRGHWIRFAIAFTMFTLQQWSGQNSIGYYAPQVFMSIGIGSTNATLFASGVYGLVKVVATTIFLFVGIEQFGRKRSLMVGAFLMGLFFFILGALFKTLPPDPHPTHVSKASIAMAVMIYLYVIPYCFSWGPVPWVYCSEIFSNDLRSYGVAWAAATQWLWNFVVSYVTPLLEEHLAHGGLFFFFASINIFSCVYAFLLPETRGLSLEDMDVLFGAVSAESRLRDRLVVRNNLMGSAYDGDSHGFNGQNFCTVYPMEGKSVAFSPESQTSVLQTATTISTVDGEYVDRELGSLEKQRYTWTIPE